jgi:hypothetical protein
MTGKVQASALKGPCLGVHALSQALGPFIFFLSFFLSFW